MRHATYATRDMREHATGEQLGLRSVVERHSADVCALVLRELVEQVRERTFPLHRERSLSDELVLRAQEALAREGAKAGGAKGAAKGFASGLAKGAAGAVGLPLLGATRGFAPTRLARSAPPPTSHS